uniref:FI14711p n=1 Tax=Drosophila melanogaster TaxID=7227 RepID=F3YDJ9_DROME|nr:FI14711p [Drosophila melanogaster]
MHNLCGHSSSGSSACRRWSWRSLLVLLSIWRTTWWCAGCATSMIGGRRSTYGSITVRWKCWLLLSHGGGVVMMGRRRSSCRRCCGHGGWKQRTRRHHVRHHGHWIRRQWRHVLHHAHAVLPQHVRWHHVRGHHHRRRYTHGIFYFLFGHRFIIVRIRLATILLTFVIPEILGGNAVHAKDFDFNI